MVYKKRDVSLSPACSRPHASKGASSMILAVIIAFSPLMHGYDAASTTIEFSVMVDDPMTMTPTSAQPPQSPQNVTTPDLLREVLDILSGTAALPSSSSLPCNTSLMTSGPKVTTPTSTPTSTSTPIATPAPAPPPGPTDTFQQMLRVVGGRAWRKLLLEMFDFRK